MPQKMPALGNGSRNSLGMALGNGSGTGLREYGFGRGFGELK